MSLIRRLWTSAAPASGGDAGHPCEPAMDAVPEAALDFRGLTAPEPMVRALAAADALPSGAAVTVLTPLMPLPLLELLATRGLLTRSRELADGGVMTLIQRPDGPQSTSAQSTPVEDKQVKGIGTTGT